jgi:hypothetical protein
MQDQYFMQVWNANHRQFSEDLHQALCMIAGGVRRLVSSPRAIGKINDMNVECPLARQARLTGVAMIGGLLMGLGTATILATLAPDAAPAATPEVATIRVSSFPLA